MTLYGILNINKSAGITSRDVVNHVARLVRPEKAGHAGTLDPLATGVLVICVGQATRLIEYVQRMPKQYRASFLLGHRSETDDIEGDVLAIAGAPRPSRAELDIQLPRFLGEIRQVPPIHSAIKVGGRRAYQLARAGKSVELSPRTVTIHRLTIPRYDYPELELEIECGGGTYIRSLGRDIAAALGTSAVMSALQRVAIGPFHVDEAVSLEALTDRTLAGCLKPSLSALGHMPRVYINEFQLEQIRHGRCVPADEVGGFQTSPPEIEYAAIDTAGNLAAIVRERRPGELWPKLNLHARLP
jgi:tRNA pseudouridine55 synthase